MPRFVVPFAVLAAMLAVALPAQAASLTRTFVSSAGNDSNPCTITQPCATFARAYALTAPDGIVAALDPGKYGPLTITTGVTINGNGWAAITAPAQGNGITVTAGGASVTLNGLEIDGVNAAYNGIVLDSAAVLTVSNCTLQNFTRNVGTNDTGNGILLEASGASDVAIVNTTVSNSSFNGIGYVPPSGTVSANIAIDHVVAVANGDGIFIDPIFASGGTVTATISNSVASNNGIGIAAIAAPGFTAKVSIDGVNANTNSIGISAEGIVNLLLGRSVITGNATGIYNTTSPNTFYSVQNNQIGLNGTDGSSSLNKTTYTLQ